MGNAGYVNGGGELPSLLESLRLTKYSFHSVGSVVESTA